MAEELIIKCCAPTLAGIKAGSIFCVGKQWGQMGVELKKCIDVLKAKGLVVKSMKGCKGQRLVYVYRPNIVKLMVEDKECACLLKNLGYCTDSTESAVNCLLNRIRIADEFPHEIGLFLGYPKEDVEGYIDNKGKNYCLCGMWKVYGDKNKAERKFAAYKKCTDVYMRCYKKGSCLDKLTVRV